VELYLSIKVRSDCEWPVVDLYLSIKVRGGC
jgi:hypothetical protein